MNFFGWFSYNVSADFTAACFEWRVHMGADEKFNTVLEQYSLEIKQMYKFGGALYLETEQGFFMLRQRPIREGRAVFEEKIKTHMSENGFQQTDKNIPSGNCTRAMNVSLQAVIQC